MCTLCDSTDINTLIEFVPNFLWNISGGGFNSGSDYRVDVCRITKGAHIEQL